MSIIQTMANNIDSNVDTCPQCGAALPQGALFCASCGERLDRKKGVTALLQDEQEISARYRILSLIRRRPAVNLYLALDTQPSARGRMVAMRDLDLSSCDEQARVSIIEQAQREYDLLRHWQPPYVMRAIDLRYAQGHLYTVAGFAPLAAAGKSPASGENDEQGEADAQQNWPRLTTLQDFLQSGQGLPSEKRALHMITCLCVAADRLHSQGIMLGDLDPSTVILNGATVDDQLGLMISWLPPGARAALLPETPAPLLSYFIAPEALQGEADVRSDIYSLGAIFYLLLTGMPPEESSLRHRSRLRSPYEINPRMQLNISESVMQALAINPNERFQTIAAFIEALRDPHYRRPAAQHDAQDELSPEAETVRILPLSHKDLARWRAGQPKKQAAVPLPVPATASAVQSQAVVSEEPSHAPASPTVADDDVATQRLNRDHPVTDNAIPATPGESRNGHRMPENIAATPASEVAEEEWDQQVPETPALTGEPTPSAPSRSLKQRIAGIWSAIKSLDIHGWIDHIKQGVLGEQQHVVAAAAIIETPLRVLPDQLYTIRLHIMGRDRAETSTNRQQSSGGLSALVHGDTAIIEVRSVLQESYAYVVQMARVTIPAEGYVAEVSIPMQPLSNTPTGRRDRLHVFFLNEHRHPLYEKPFVLEIFVSHHVKRGSEGHHVLTIPV